MRVAALAKQVPVVEAMELGPDGRITRQGADVEMNAYCRRAVAMGVELARTTGGRCTVLTLGPPAAEDVLREAVAWGADGGVHLCDVAFAGSDTLASARAIAAALVRLGGFDLVLCGRNTLDGDTGQVGPEVAQLLGLPFATGAKSLKVDGGALCLHCELDDGWEDVTVSLPAVVSVAERLCAPAKMPPEARAAVPPERLRVMAASDVGTGPWGDRGSATRVGAVRAMGRKRDRIVLAGPVDAQAADVVAGLESRGVLMHGGPGPSAATVPEWAGQMGTAGAARGTAPVAVLLEAGRPRLAAELLGAAAGIAAQIGGWVVALCPPGSAPDAPRSLGADEVVDLDGVPIAEDVAAAVAAWAGSAAPWALLAPSTSFGREVAGRVAAALGCGLAGDALGLHVASGRLVAAKPAFSGALVADVICTSELQMVTVRPGVLPVLRPRGDGPVARSAHAVVAAGRVRVLGHARDDDVEVLATARAVVAVGAGVDPGDYEVLDALVAVLGAERAASRKVTDKGWMPRARQVGITGRSIAPRLYVTVGISGKFNHMAGARSAECVLAVNSDEGAPVFGLCDIGMVADYRQAVPALARALRGAGELVSGRA